MSEKSVSQIANERREKDHEASRKSVSPNKAKAQNPNSNWGRKEQRETSVKGPNLGSNRNMGRAHESEVMPEHQPQGGFGYTEDQTERSHSQAPVVEKGALDNRKTADSAVAERHVRSDDGFKIAERRSASVVANRKMRSKSKNSPGANRKSSQTHTPHRRSKFEIPSSFHWSRTAGLQPACFDRSTKN